MVHLMSPKFLYPRKKHFKRFREARGTSFSDKGEEGNCDRKGKNRKVVKPAFRKCNFRKATEGS